MNVSEALQSRISCRAYLDKPVPEEHIREILEKAKRAPSGGNLQPWHVYVMSGDKLQTFVSSVAEKVAANPKGEGSEYDIYPKGLSEPYKARRSKCGEDMYAAIDVKRDDKIGRMMQFARNFELFGAPSALFFSIDRQMGLGQWADLGMFLQSIMLVAREYDIPARRKPGLFGTKLSPNLSICPMNRWSFAGWHWVIWIPAHLLITS